MVSELGIACSVILSTKLPGSGLKLMRLVSKQLSIAMMALVQSYTVKIDGCGTGLMGMEMALLKYSRTRLSHLRVVITDNTAGRLVDLTTQKKQIIRLGFYMCLIQDPLQQILFGLWSQPILNTCNKLLL